jgi:Protein of unknown function (DUF2971)
MNLPPHLYRYRTAYTDEDIGRIAAILKTNQLYFTSRKRFNDPFDCRIPITWNASFKAVKRKLREVYQRKHPNLSPRELGKMIKLWRKRGDIDEMTIGKGGIQAMERMMDEVGILCLSSKKDDILMWSHYAAGHSGICFEFDTKEYPFSDAKNVNYQEPFPTPNAFTTDRDQVAKEILLTKASGWTYEGEWRLIINAIGLVPIPPQCISGLILGCEISPNREMDIRHIIADRAFALKVYRARKCAGRYGLEIIDA